MKVSKIKIELKDGAVNYIDDENQLKEIVDCLPKTLKFKKLTNKETLQNKYFAMVLELSKNTQCGYTKMEIHNLLKPVLFKEIIDFPTLFENNLPEFSTKNLTAEGWSTLIEQLRVAANDLFEGYVFEN
jgi:hypothetical protein